MVNTFVDEEFTSAELPMYLQMSALHLRIVVSNRRALLHPGILDLDRSSRISSSSLISIILLDRIIWIEGNIDSNPNPLSPFETYAVAPPTARWSNRLNYFRSFQFQKSQPQGRQAIPTCVKVIITVETVTFIIRCCVLYE